MSRSERLRVGTRQSRRHLQVKLPGVAIVVPGGPDGSQRFTPCLFDVDTEAGDRAEDDGDVKSPAARPEVDADGSENRAGGKGDVEPPACRFDPNAEAEKAPGDAHASRPTSPQPERQTTSPEPGFTQTFPNFKEFLAFASAELKRQEYNYYSAKFMYAF